jgi:ribosomal peptide maturation radical SAM protein 1
MGMSQLPIIPGKDWAEFSRPSRPLRVALVNMPWVRTDAPSIQCGLLKAGACRYGHHADVHYLNLELAAALGPQVYDVVCGAPGKRQNFLGEWLFGAAAYGDCPGPQTYLDRYPDLLEVLSQHDISAADICRLREKTLPEWIACHAGRIADAGYDVVGFTTTFEQNVASFALARHLKQISPKVVTVFGGANFDDEMGPEYVRVVPCIDYAVIGEGDLIFPVLLAHLADGNSPIGLPGVWGRSDGKVAGDGAGPMVRDMDVLPLPDFGDYFATLNRLGQRQVLGGSLPRLLYEASRGCWWGEKHHCTFCGLNGLAMTFRSKSPGRVFDELTTLAGRYQVAAIDAVDNILDMNYLTTLCERLRTAPWDPNLFFELKANLTRSQIRLLRTAGIQRIQPGLESLSSHVLSLMRKGTTMLINTQLLKWAHYYGILVFWGIITGFPGETEQDYQDQIELIPSLYHLPPPQGVGPVWLERFSPYYTEDFPVHDVRPREAYSFAYPIPGIDLNRIAYFFDHSAEGIASPQVCDRLAEAVGQWRARWAAPSPPVLSYVRGPDWIAIQDTRCEVPRRFTISGWRAAAYEHCGDKARNVPRLRELLQSSGATGATGAAITRFLDTCLKERLMVSGEGRYLSLALPAPERD